MSRSVKLLIVVSLILNVLLGGMVLGHMWHRMNDTPPDKEKVLATLPAERQEEFRAMMKEARREGERLRKDIREQRDVMRRILKAEKFDEAAYKKQMERMHELYGKRKQMMVEGVAKLARKWSLNERQALAELMRRPSGVANREGSPSQDR